jgi:hypothetical protein
MILGAAALLTFAPLSSRPRAASIIVGELQFKRSSNVKTEKRQLVEQLSPSRQAAVSTPNVSYDQSSLDIVADAQAAARQCRWMACRAGAPLCVRGLAKQAGHNVYGLLGDLQRVVSDPLQRTSDEDHEHRPLAHVASLADLD